MQAIVLRWPGHRRLIGKQIITLRENARAVIKTRRQGTGVSKRNNA